MNTPGAFLVLLCAILCACGDQATDTLRSDSAIPDTSTFFATAFVEEAAAFDAPSDGDLWPSAWSDDDLLYAANGDGKGFSLDSAWSDIVSNRISGHPRNGFVEGERLAGGDRVGTVWGDTASYNRKPTGMLSIGGVLYLAVQDLRKEGPHIFSEAASATILRSDDKGRTWHWDRTAPMFDDYVFTTIVFLDYGRDASGNTFDEYVYAYGLDDNWRDSFSDVVPDPQNLYLARMPRDGIQDLSTWEFYTGDLDGNASWSEPGRLSDRRPVLRDTRRRYEATIRAVNPDSLSVVSQGGIVYNEALNRYIYMSWTEFTFEFYEAPAPWGPWKLFLSKDFGAYPWTERAYGGYATVAPSKYISEDGSVMWISSSTFAGGVEHYAFSLRRLWITPYRETTPSNEPSSENLAASADPREVAPISSGAVRHGRLTAINDRQKAENTDSYGVEVRQKDYWGYTWPRTYHLNRLVYTTGEIDEPDGGWFNDLEVQVRRNFKWVDAQNVHITPSYTFDARVEANADYTIHFDDTWGDGIRIIGRPGGDSSYTSISELEVYYE